MSDRNSGPWRASYAVAVVMKPPLLLGGKACKAVQGGKSRRLKPCAWLSRSASGRPIASSASHAHSTAPARLRATRRPPSKVQSAFMLKPSMPGTFPRLKVASRRRQRPSSTTKKNAPAGKEAEALKSCAASGRKTPACVAAWRNYGGFADLSVTWCARPGRDPPQRGDKYRLHIVSV